MKGKQDIKLGRENLTKLFFFATAQTHFSFLENFYNEIDGVAMALFLQLSILPGQVCVCWELTSDGLVSLPRGVKDSQSA